MNLLTITQTFATEDQALDYLISARWPKGVRCLACDHDKVYRIATVGKTGKPCRLFECADCGLHFSATTGTLFHDSHLPLRKWFMAMALMAEAKKGISANQVARHIGVQYKTAWHLCHRIRKAMEELNAAPLGGEGKIIEIDEARIGGRKLRKGVKAGVDNKVRIIGIAERYGKVHMQTIQDGKAATLKPVFDAKLDPNTERYVTDSAASYAALLPAEKHQETSHKDDLRERGFVENQTVENAFSLFKRGLVGSYHKLSKDHLDSYLQEFCWRYNRRDMQPEMFGTLLRELVTKKPLTYRKLTREIF
jgi:transposase-like protein